MGLTYIPPRRNQFQNQMFNMLSQMAFQKMNHKQRMELADREIKLYDTRIKEKQAYEKAKLEEERKYEAGKDSEERESKLLEKGFTVFPAKTATTTPTATGINQKANKNIFFDKTTGKIWIRPPEKEGPLVKQYRLAKKEGFKGNFVDFKKTAATGKGPKIPTEAELTQRAAMGDPKAQFLLDAMNKQASDKASAASQGKIAGLLKQMGGAEGVATAVIEGREDWGKIKNTFGVPMIEMIRKEILAKDKNFDFIVPTAVYKSLTASLGNQEKQYGMMQSFVKNINAQVDRVGERMKDIGRWDLRALDIPRRALVKRFVGSGKEVVLEAYLTEISNEINKLSQGSQASIAQLGEESQKRWNSIHDPNLSLKELQIVLDETKNMANMRMKSVSDTIELTKERMQNVMKPDRTSADPSDMTDDELLKALNE